jgi:hypothetical protein
MGGKQVRAYRDEPGVAHNSNTETFAALELFVDNWRWHGVPFYLRTGKRLPVKASEISIQFCRVPHRAFPPEAAPDFRPVRLIISIQPYEGIVMKIHMAPSANRSFAGVIFGLRPPLRPRVRAVARPALRSRSRCRPRSLAWAGGRFSMPSWPLAPKLSR